MTRIDTGRESGEILCQALGLDPYLVRGIEIVWRPHECPFARVELLLNEAVIYEIVRLGPLPPIDGAGA